MVHAIKCYPQYFAAVRADKKPFELRENDRDYKVGDYLALNEYDRSDGKYTGDTELVRITYILNPNDVMTCEGGWAILGIERVMQCDRVEVDNG